MKKLTKREFKSLYITNNIHLNDCPANRQLWCDSLFQAEKDGYKVNHNWIKTPAIFYGERA